MSTHATQNTVTICMKYGMWTQFLFIETPTKFGLLEGIGASNRYPSTGGSPVWTPMLANVWRILEHDSVSAASSITVPLVACRGLELSNVDCRTFSLHNTLPCCPIYSVFHPIPLSFTAVMTQFPLWHAWPSGINKVNLMLPYLILPWIPASLRNAGTFAICGAE